MFNRSLAARVIYGDMCYDIKLTSYIKNIASNLSSLAETYGKVTKDAESELLLNARVSVLVRATLMRTFYLNI